MSTPKWKRRLRIWLSLGVVWIALIGAWEGAYRTIGWRAWVFPAPTHVADALLSMLNVRTCFGEPLHAGWPWHPEAQSHLQDTQADAARAERSVAASPLISAVGVSLVRLAIGFAFSLTIGILLALVLWRHRFMDRLFGPVCLGLQTLPSVCWVPLAILTLGISETGVLAVLVMGSVFSVAIAMRDGLRTLPPIYAAAGRMLGARGVRLYTSVLLPASLPALAGTLRQGFSFAWRSLLGAELILMTQRRGVGYLLNVGREFADVAQVVAVMLVMVVIGMTIDRWVFARIERRVRRRFGLTASR